MQRFKSVLQQAGVDSTRYSGHSFWIGGATTAAANRIGDATTQSLGRWANDSYTWIPGTGIVLANNGSLKEHL